MFYIFDFKYKINCFFLKKLVITHLIEGMFDIIYYLSREFLRHNINLLNFLSFGIVERQAR